MLSSPLDVQRGRYGNCFINSYGFSQKHDFKIMAVFKMLTDVCAYEI